MNKLVFVKLIPPSLQLGEVDEEVGRNLESEMGIVATLATRCAILDVIPFSDLCSLLPNLSNNNIILQASEPNETLYFKVLQEDQQAIR